MSLDLPAPSADVPPATSSDLKRSPFASTFRDPTIDMPLPLATFLIPSSTVIDFTSLSFCFLGLSIPPILSIHFSAMIDPLRAPPMDFSTFVDIDRLHSAFQFPR
jgi:hypothetical protein